MQKRHGSARSFLPSLIQTAAPEQAQQCLTAEMNWSDSSCCCLTVCMNTSTAEVSKSTFWFCCGKSVFQKNEKRVANCSHVSKKHIPLHVFLTQIAKHFSLFSFFPFAALLRAKKNRENHMRSVFSFKLYRKIILGSAGLLPTGKN